MVRYSRFDIKQQLGEGSFSKIYQAYDKLLKKEVALKVEKEDKHKNILKLEYEILLNLQGISILIRVTSYT
jgi:serine/threonine protein kinase